MEKYKNLSRDSSVYAYKIGMNYIDVQLMMAQYIDILTKVPGHPMWNK